MLKQTLTFAAAVGTVAAFAASAIASDQIPGEQQNVALVGGTIYTAAGEPIENGTIVIEDGKIKAVGAGLAVPDGFERIDTTGQRIYPGLFEASTDIGLIEINAVRASRDFNEAGSVNPNALAAVSVNPDSELIPTTRANGVLLCHTHPSGGLVSGQGSVLQLDGWTYEEMTVARSSGVVMNWPRMLPIQAWWMEDSVDEQLKQRNEQLRGIEIFLAQANRYSMAKDVGSADYDAKLEAMLPVLAGEKPLLVVANEQQQIQLAVAFTQRHGLKMVLMGGRDAGKCADLLKAADVPVVLIGTQRSPGARDNGYDTAYKLPADLHEAGVKFAIASDRRSSFARNLPYHAGAAIAFGLPEDVALQAITSAPADILGVGDRVGTIEVGKDATLFVADGDIFETPTAVTKAWIAGAPVDLSSRHTMLSDKYKKRYGLE